MRKNSSLWSASSATRVADSGNIFRFWRSKRLRTHLSLIVQLGVSYNLHSTGCGCGWHLCIVSTNYHYKLNTWHLGYETQQSAQCLRHTEYNFYCCMVHNELNCIWTKSVIKWHRYI
uniref:Uncharacterized protein n=1 Tax=Arundo donax TaxID=35708 RepID=A0A0A9VMD7_ARUDO